MKKNWLRWLPAGIVPAVILTAAIAGPTIAETKPELPDKTTQELLELVAEGTNTSYSGTLEQSSDLGLPALQGLESPHSADSTGASGVLELLTGSHTARVHTDGADKARIQVMDQLAQRDVIVNNNDVWLYNSRAKEATHATLPDHKGTKARAIPGPAHTPADLAATFLSTIDSSTDVTVGDNSRVAGRSAYQLVLTPRTTDTLIGVVSLTVDAKTGLPLSFAVSARGQADPAFSVAFSSIDVGAPAEGLFEFTPPPGATVTEAPATNTPVKEHHDDSRAAPKHSSAPDTAVAPAPDTAPDMDTAPDKPSIIGAGWSTIVALPAGSASEAFGAKAFGANASEDAGARGGASPDGNESAEASALLEQALTPVDGGRVLQTALVSVLITDDGRVLAGAVSADQLIAAAQQ